MIHRHSVAALLTAALAAPLVSQGGPPAMTLKTSDRGLAEKAAEMFGHEEPLPELPRNKSWKLVAKGDGSFKVTLDTKAVSRAQMTVNPAKLMTDFAEGFANLAAELEPIMMASLQRTGLPENMAAELFNGLFAVPLETQSVAVGAGSLTPSFDFGWLFLNLNVGVDGLFANFDLDPGTDGTLAQSYVSATHTALNRFEVGLAAIELTSACDDIDAEINFD